jgi:amino acid adenylation domain-containing protein
MLKEVNENLLLTSGKYLKQKEYWLKKLGSTTVRDLTAGPLPFPLQAEATAGSIEASAASIAIDLPEQVQEQLFKLGSQSELTIYIILATALKALIYRYTGAEEIVMASPLYKSPSQQRRFNNHLLIHDQIPEGATFKELLLLVRQSVLDAYENQDYPMDKLLEILNNGANRREGGGIGDLVAHSVGCWLTPLHETVTKESKENRQMLRLVFSVQGDIVTGAIHYNSRKLDSAYIKQLAGHYIGILEHCLSNVNASIHHIPLMTDQERQHLESLCSNADRDIPVNGTIIQSFRQVVKQHPEATALFHNGTTLSYRHLDRLAGRLASQLKEKGAIPGDIIGLLMDRSLETVIAIMGILQAGCAYLPISPGYPLSRQGYMIEDSHLRFLITNCDCKELVDRHSRRLEIIHLPAGDYAPDSDNGHLDNEPYHDQAKPTDAAYVIYTSGSSGKPKGVVVEHRNVVNVVHWFGKTYGLAEGYRVLSLTETTFDASVNQIFGSLLHGATCYIPNREIIADAHLLRGYICNHRIQLVNFIPSFLQELLCGDQKLDSVEAVISGAERLDPSLNDRILSRGYTLYNQYGPTETTIDALSARCRQGVVTLGKPIANARCLILDKQQNLMPPGAKGEIWVGGAGVTRGYLNDPEKTAAAFVENANGETMYRTGDLARLLPNGEFLFLDRLDRQVKLRGYRIELGEIESFLEQHESIADAVVVLMDHALCAYLLPEPGQEALLDQKGIREFLMRKLPDYMIPQYVVLMEAFPRIPSGKVDRGALPQPELDAVDTDYQAPRDQLDQRLARLWSDILGIAEEKIGIDHVFFDLGGHSIKAIILGSRIHKEFNVKIPLAQIFEAPTIRVLAQFIKQEGGGQRYAPIQPAAEQAHYPLSSAQKRLFFMHQMESDDPYYHIPIIVNLEGKLDRDRLERTFQQLVQRHESLRTSFHTLDHHPVQRIHPHLDLDIQYSEIPLDLEETAGKKAEATVIDSWIQPFDLADAPLMRVGLIATGKDRYILVVDIHHIITDGFSQEIMVREFTTLYNGGRLPPMEFQYKDYSEWQNSRAGQEAIAAQKDYWLAELTGPLPQLNLPLDNRRPEEKSDAGATASFRLPNKETEALRSMAQRHGTTLYTLNLALFFVFLSRICRQEDIIVGTPVAGRNRAELDCIFGFFVNMLPLRNRPEGSKSFSTFLGEVKQRTIEAFENQDFPFDELVTALSWKRIPSRHPVFDVGFTFRDIPQAQSNGPEAQATEDSLTVTPYPMEHTNSTFDLSMTGTTAGGDIHYLFEYKSLLFKGETIQRFIELFKELVSTVINDEEIHLGQIKFAHRLETASADILQNDSEDFVFN